MEVRDHEAAAVQEMAAVWTRREMDGPNIYLGGGRRGEERKESRWLLGIGKGHIWDGEGWGKWWWDEEVVVTTLGAHRQKIACAQYGMPVRLSCVGVNKALGIEEWNSEQSSGLKIHMWRHQDSTASNPWLGRGAPTCCVNVRQAKFF